MSAKNLRHSLFCRAHKFENWVDYLFVTLPNGKLLYCNADTVTLTKSNGLLIRKGVPMTAK